MHLVINQWTPLGSKTGIGHYTDELLRCLRVQCGTDRLSTFPSNRIRHFRDMGGRLRSWLLRGGEAKEIRRQGDEETRRARLRVAAVQQLRRVSWGVLGRQLRKLHARQRFDLYHEPNFIPLPVDCPTVTTLHDLSVLVHPEWHPSDRVAWFAHQLPSVLSRCAHFLTISEFVRQEVIRVLGVSPERISTTCMGVRPRLVPLHDREYKPVLQKLGIPPQYLLYVGTIEPRKNVLMLMQAYCSLPEQLRAQWPLVLVGGWGWNVRAAAEYFQSEARHRGVIHLGYVPEEHLAGVYNGARALLYPSWYEGFGMPPLEMMACGGAVLASTAGSIVETTAGRAHLIDPADRDGWRSAMHRLLTDDNWWCELRRNVTEIARPYTWERCAAETWQVYRQVASSTAKGVKHLRPAA